MALEGVLMRCLGLNEEKESIETVNAGFGWERESRSVTSTDGKPRVHRLTRNGFKLLRSTRGSFQ
jgi:hypothetical protein